MRYNSKMVITAVLTILVSTTVNTTTSSPSVTPLTSSVATSSTSSCLRTSSITLTTTSSSLSTTASLAPSAVVSSSLSSPLLTAAVLPAASVVVLSSPLSTTTVSLAPSAAVSSSSSSSSPLLTATALPAPSTTVSSLPLSATTTTTTSNNSSIDELVKKFILSLNKADFQQENSLQDVSDLFQETIEQSKNGPLQEGRRESIFKGATAFEDFLLKYGQYHLSESTPLLNKNYSTLDLRIKRVFRKNASDFQLEGSEKQNFINIPSSNFDDNGSVLVGIIYKTLHEALKSDHASNNNREIDTMIMAATMDPKPEHLQQNIVLTFRNLKDADGTRICTFWNGYSEKSPDGWSGEGCHVVMSKSNSRETACSCNHMSHFAALYNNGVRPEIVKEDEKLNVLTILIYVGLSLSIVGLILMIITYALLADARQPLSQIRMNFAASLGAGQVIFLASINATENMGTCVAVAAIVQYFMMAAFCWLFVEGIHLYLSVSKVYSANKMTMYYVMSWGFPAIILAISLSIAAGKGGIQNFASDEYCWMSPVSNFTWIFVSFLVMIEVPNLLILIRVIMEMTTMQPTGENHVQQIRMDTKTCLMLIPLLLVTWLFGLLSPFHKALVYIFTILNSSQGLLIFHRHCVRNSQIRNRFRTAIFPAVNSGQSSQVNPNDIRGASQRIEVQSCSV